MTSLMQAAGPGPVPLGLLCNRHGDGSGTRILMTAGLQGDDISGVQTLGTLHNSLQHLCISHPDAMLGTADLYPVVHPQGVDALGFQTRIDSSTTSLVASQLQSAAQNAALCIHVSAGAADFEGVPRAEMLAKHSSAFLNAVKQADMQAICLRERFSAGSLSEQLENMGVPVLSLTLGARTLTVSESRRFVRGLRSIMAILGVVDDGLERAYAGPEARIVHERELHSMRASVTGIFELSRLCPEDIWPDQKIGVIRDILSGEVLMDVKSPEHGQLLSWRRTGVVRPGQLLAQLAPFVDA